MGTPNHTNLAPFSDISGMSSGAGDLLSASVGLGNGATLLNGNSIFCRLEAVKFVQVYLLRIRLHKLKFLSFKNRAL